MRTLTLGRAISAALVSLLLLALLPADTAWASQTPTTLVDIRAAHHPGYDRIVFEFDRGLPEFSAVRWTNQLRLDPSHKRARVQGDGLLQVRFRWAVAHTDLGPTVSPARQAFGLPNINHLVLLGDHEGEVSLGIGLMKRTAILKTYRLRHPARFVVDVASRFPKVTADVYFVDEPAVISGQPPFVVPVRRRVPADGHVEGALQRLYAGPTQAELDAGLRFVSSKTRGLRDLWINWRGVARATLRGRCDSGGSAEVTVASQIIPTLRSRPAIDWVKVYDRDGQTNEPWGLSDSIPACLEP